MIQLEQVLFIIQSFNSCKKKTKARVTRACDIYHYVSQPVVTLSFVSRHDQSEAQDSTADQSEAGPGSVPQHVIGCIRSITV